MADPVIWSDREIAAIKAVRAGTVTRAEVQESPFAVLWALRKKEKKPTLTWVRCPFWAQLTADGESLPGGPDLPAALCSYLQI